MSTGTNKERLEQNNLKLEEIKSQVQNLPKYPNIKPIYGTGDYAVIKITSPNSSYRYICAANGFGDYIAVQFCNVSNFSSSSAKFTNHYLYKIENGAPTLITILPNTGEGSLSFSYYSVSPFGFYDNKIYYYVFNTNWAEAKTSFFCRTYDLTSGEIVSKTLTYPYRITTISTVYDDFVVGGGYSSAVCKLDPATDKFTSLGSAPSSGTYLSNDVFVYATNTSSVLSLWNDYVVTRTKTYSYDSTEYSTKCINGVNIAKDKIFQGKNCYRLNSDLSIGELIKENALLTNGVHYILNDKYMFSGGTLYSYDDKTVTFEPVATFTGGTYKLLPACNSIMYFNSDKTSITFFTFGKTDTIIGITYDDKIWYYGQDKDIKASYLLENREMYDGAGNMVVGTMPNNGELNYTPSTEQQTIPVGYTSGGTISAVDNSIDSNIAAENIKKDVSILGITGTLESGIDTSDATATANDIISGKTAYANGEKITGTLNVPIDSITYDRMNTTVTVTNITLLNPSTEILLDYCRKADNLENSVTTQYFGDYYDTDGNYWISTSFSPSSPDLPDPKYFYIMIQSSRYGTLMYNDVDVVAAGYTNDTKGTETGWYFSEPMGMSWSKATDSQVTALLRHFKGLDFVVKTNAKTESDLAFVPNMCQILDKSITVDIVSTVVDTSDATATAEQLPDGVTAYVNGEKIIGTMPNNGQLTFTPSTEQQTIPAGYTSGGKVAGDSNLTANNIKLGVSIFGVEGNLEPDKPDQTKTATPTTEEQVITPDTGYELASVTVEAVTNSIDSNIVAENIKKDVSILGVTGTLEAGGGSGDVKLFETVEQMQADNTAQEGDLAVVYRSEVQNATVDSKFQTATFPDTVVLDTAMAGSIEVRYRAVDSSKMFDCMGSLDSSGFSMDCYTESGEIRIQYTSSDGITYTRTDTTGNPVDFGTEICYEMAETWNDAIGKFIQVSGKHFDGLFEYNLNVVDTENVNAYKIGTQCTEFIPVKFNINNVKLSDKAILARQGIMVLSETEGTFDTYYCEKNSSNYIYLLESVDSAVLYKYSSSNVLVKETYVDYKFVSEEIIPNLYSDNIYFGKLCVFWGLNGDNIIPVLMKPFGLGKIKYTTTSGIPTYSDSTEITFEKSKYDILINTYLNAPTQLSITPDYVYKKEFYGKNGVEVGTLQNKENLTKDEVKRRVDMWSSYNSGIVCPNNVSNIFNGYTNLTTIPLLDTSKVTNMGYMFYNCTNLTTIPLLNTSNATNMYSMFQICSSLSDESLNNILAMCTNATSYTSVKTLAYLGLTSAQANKCKTLSNYEAFTAAGWSTGY